MAAPELIATILQRYGLAPAAVLPMQSGYRSEVHPVELTDGRTVCLVLYKREPGSVRRIRDANRIGDHLAAQGLPARRTADQRIIRLQGASGAAFGALYEYLPGETIPWEAYTMDRLKELGATMGTMHIALRDIPHGTLPGAADECRELLGRMLDYFAADGVRQALDAKLGLIAPTHLEPFGTLFDTLAARPDQQPLHLDFVRGNILFEPSGSRITGILDFEKAAWGSPVFDLARTLAFLLVDCKHKPAGKVRRYFLQSGYGKRGGGAIPAAGQLEPLTDFFLLHDFYKFLRHNPYEALPLNEHYRRTAFLLLQRKIIAGTVPLGRGVVQ